MISYVLIRNRSPNETGVMEKNLIIIINKLPKLLFTVYLKTLRGTIFTVEGLGEVWTPVETQSNNKFLFVL